MFRQDWLLPFFLIGFRALLFPFNTPCEKYAGKSLSAKWRFAACVAITAAAITLPSGFATSQWTTPVPLNPSSASQGEPYIAIGSAGLVAVATGEGPVAVYLSSDRGGTFSRTTIPLPPVPHYAVRGARGVAFDRQANMYVLWRWDETDGLVTWAEYYVLSKSTDSGATYSTFWQSRQPLLEWIEPVMHIDQENSIHLIWDSTTVPTEFFRLHYTKFINGSPTNRVDYVLPRPQDTLRELSASFLVSEDTVHYAVGVNHLGPPFYARSTDGGLSFFPFIAMDTVVAHRPVLLPALNGIAVLFGVYVDDPSPYRLPVVKLISDSLFPHVPSTRVGTTKMDLEAPKSLIVFGNRYHLLYQGVETQHATCYYEYDSLESPPVDSAYFTTLRLPKLVMDSSGGKYLFAVHRTENRVYIARKDIVDGVDDQNRAPARGTPSIRVLPNDQGQDVFVGVYLEQPAVGSLKVFDILGREVRQLYSGKMLQGDQGFHLSKQGLSSGVYFISLRTSIGNVASKFLITR